MFVGSFRIISSEADTVAPLKVSEAETDAVISTYIQDFVQRAYAENPEFNRLDKSKQQAILNTFAVEKLKEINTKDILFNQIFGTPPIDNGASE